VSSHLLFEVEQICTHVTIINRGNKLVSDTLQNVSGMITGPAAVHVEVANLSGAVVEAVKALPFVSEVTFDGDKLRIRLITHDDVRAQVSQQITKAGGTIVGMSVEGSNLEDVFLQLISKDGGGKPQLPIPP
jgi:ABC-2 type transport system ATP-binding protein